MNELKNRGLQDILIAVVDGLKGFPEAITAAFPEAMVQTCPRHGHSDQWRFHGSIWRSAMPNNTFIDRQVWIAALL